MDSAVTIKNGKKITHKTSVLLKRYIISERTKINNAGK